MKFITRWRLLAFTLSAGAALVLGRSTLAGDADVLKSYRFVWRQSTLDETHPGLERPDIQYNVFGTFDVLYSPGTNYPWAAASAEFQNVHAIAENPLTAMAPLDLDEVLNLSGLQGKQLPVASPFDVYQFLGKTKDGSSVQLFADLIGQWFLLHGGTTLPEGQQIGTEYSIQAVARVRPFADFNDDLVVDGGDLKVLLSHFGETSPLDDATFLGDADGNHLVDGADLLAWQSQLGEKPTGVFAGAGAVPEPSSIVLLVGAAITLGTVSFQISAVKLRN